MERDPRKGTCADNVVLGRVFTKIFQAGQGSGNFLDFVKNEQSVIRVNLMSNIQF